MPAQFSDVNANYGRGRPEILEDIKAIENSLDNIMGTQIGERFFLPTFGSGLLDIIHEPINEVTAEELLDRITDAIDTWEPRVEVRVGRSQIVPDPDRNLYQVLVVYIIRSLGVESSIRRDVLVSQG